MSSSQRYCDCRSGLGAAQGAPCVFSPWVYSEQAKQVQKHLATVTRRLKVDGLWGECSESAYRKVFGKSPTAADLADLFGVQCGALVNVLAGKRDLVCADGSDEIIADDTGNVGLPQFMRESRRKLTTAQQPIDVLAPPQSRPPAGRLRLPGQNGQVTPASSQHAGALPISNRTLLFLGGAAAIAVVGWALLARKH